MKFFPYELIAAANEWVDESPAEARQAVAKFNRAAGAYLRHLDSLRGRVPEGAWQFFRHGTEEDSLHDARLVELRAGDGPVAAAKRRPQGRKPSTFASLEFVSIRGWTATFECRGVRRLQAALWLEQPRGSDLGDLYTYELRTAGKNRLALGFVFASGGEVDIEFERLAFRRAPGHPGRRTTRIWTPPVKTEMESVHRASVRRVR